jgi:hypothetical protein
MCRRIVPLVVGVLCLMGLVGVSPALAESAWWKLAMSSTPSVLVPGGEARIIVEASNLGDGVANVGPGAPVKLSLHLPSWLEPVSIVAPVGPTAAESTHGVRELLGLGAGDMSCPEDSALPGAALVCESAESIVPFGTLELLVTVRVAADAPPSGLGEATVEGGGICSRRGCRLRLGSKVMNWSLKTKVVSRTRRPVRIRFS